jgi:hypothetical protein
LFASRLVAVFIVAGAGLSAQSALTQEDLNRGKTPAQLFASDCADCHRNPRTLAKRENAGALADFLRVHYTASRESAVAIAAYLVSLGPDPRSGSGRPATQRSRPAASQDQSKSHQTRPATLPAEPDPPVPPETVPPAPAAAPAPEPANEPTPAVPADPQ